MNQPPEIRSAPRIFTSQALAEGMALELEPGPSRHLSASLRLQAGAAVTLFDGRGGEYAATISEIHRKRVSLQLGAFDPTERETGLRLELGIGISRGDRMDLVVQKSTELGVACINPLLSERTEVKLKGERLEKKMQHWRQVAISACEQCGRNRLPEIAPLCTLADWLPTVQAQRKLVLHHRNDCGLDNSARPDSVTLLIGPEGGLTGDEIDQAEAAGFQALQLGPRVLRTETAPLAALAILNYQWGDMN